MTDARDSAAGAPLSALSDEERTLIGRLPTQYRERVLAIIGRHEQEALRRIAEVEAREPCHFPPERHWKFGHVTHMRHLETIGDFNIEACVVCGSVRASPVVALAGGHT